MLWSCRPKESTSPSANGSGFLEKVLIDGTRARSRHSGINGFKRHRKDLVKSLREPLLVSSYCYIAALENYADLH